MRKLMLILAILLSFAVVASAEVPSPLSFYAGGAFSMPNGPTAFKDAYKTGYHGWIGAGYTVAPTFQVVGKIEHNHFAFDNGSFTGVEGGSMKIWMYGADAKFSPKVPTFPIKPFMFAGAGWASSKISEFTGSNTLATAVLNEGTNQTVTKMYWNIARRRLEMAHRNANQMTANPTVRAMKKGRFSQPALCSMRWLASATAWSDQA